MMSRYLLSLKVVENELSSEPVLEVLVLLHSAALEDGRASADLVGMIVVQQSFEGIAWHSGHIESAHP